MLAISCPLCCREDEGRERSAKKYSGVRVLRRGKERGRHVVKATGHSLQKHSTKGKAAISYPNQPARIYNDPSAGVGD